MGAYVVPTAYESLRLPFTKRHFDGKFMAYALYCIVMLKVCEANLFFAYPISVNNE